jgi:hypothetical protein
MHNIADYSVIGFLTAFMLVAAAQALRPRNL